MRFWLMGAMLSVGISGGVAAATEFPRVALVAGGHRIDAEVAHTAALRATGLMHRDNLPPHHGMVLVFPHAAMHCVWMRNTLIPLSVAFLDDDGKIINIERMAPRNDIQHCAHGSARYALEMNAGWFSEKGVGPGTRVHGVESLPPAQ